MGKLEGRVAIVTGSGRGIGAGVARLLAREGASVVVNDLGVALDGSSPDSTPAQQVVNDIKAAGGQAVANYNDIAELGSAEQLIRQAIDSFGKLDILVNVAGILRDRMLFNMSEQEWDAVIRVHLKGTFNTSRHAAAYWREQRNPEGHFRLINFTSGSGLHGAPGQPNYAAAKMGIVGFTYSCANALARYGVTSNAIAPGAATRMTESIPDQRRRSPQDGDERAPENVAPAVAFLASEGADWCNGQVISARGYEIGLYNKPQLLSQIVGTGPWDRDLDKTFDLLEHAFRPLVTGQGGAFAPAPAPQPAQAR
ncbi:MAG: SDR family NAD(P)-dependent oxidoreductase [Chloroflexi bacterium]|nr:SDR family NAD(P)-dependent oxidoreductase [Chloroflexota bacterium]